MRISDWSSDVCSSDLADHFLALAERPVGHRIARHPPGIPLQPLAHPHLPLFHEAAVPGVEIVDRGLDLVFGQIFVPSPARQDKEFGQRRVAHDISCGSIGGTKSSRGEPRPGRRHDATDAIIATTAGATTPARTTTAVGRTTPMTKTIDRR